jgi:hypothetical protein
VPEFVFPRPGVWTCVARGTAEGRDDNLDTAVFGTPWSAPLAIEVHSDFRYREEAISRPRSKRPRLTFTAEWPDVAKGGRASLTLFRVKGCRGRRYRLRRIRSPTPSRCGSWSPASACSMCSRATSPRARATGPDQAGGGIAPICTSSPSMSACEKRSITRPSSKCRIVMPGSAIGEPVAGTPMNSPT